MLKKIMKKTFIIFLFCFLQSKEYVYDVEIQGISIIAGNVGRCNLKIEKNEHNEYDMTIVTKTTNLALLLNKIFEFVPSFVFFSAPFK